MQCHNAYRCCHLQGGLGGAAANDFAGAGGDEQDVIRLQRYVADFRFQHFLQRDGNLTDPLRALADDSRATQLRCRSMVAVSGVERRAQDGLPSQ